MIKEMILAIKYEACRIGVEPELLGAFVEVESGGRGFDPDTGKIIIQFEPVWFKRKVPYAPSGKWSLNKVEIQAKEWVAFNDAFKINSNGAMEATSIGLGQIMGFHYKRLGYNTVGEMWDDAKKGLDRQIYQMVKFIESHDKLFAALKAKNYHLIAVYYNGAGYKEIAKKYGRVPYDKAIEKAYERFKTNKLFK